MKKSILIFFIVIFGIVFYSCGKECTDDTNPECSNYNPCKNKVYLEDILMFQKFSYPLYKQTNIGLLQTDTIYKSEFFDKDIVPFYYNDVYVFEAKYKNAKSYKWKIGNHNKEFTEHTVEIPLVAGIGKLKIQLFVEYDENAECNKTKKKFDTIVKEITIADNRNDLSYCGNKYNISDINNNSKIIEISNVFFKCNQSGSEGGDPPLVLNLIDNVVFNGGSFYSTHFCANEIYLYQPRSCSSYIPQNTQEFDKYSTLGVIKLNKNKIYISYKQKIQIIKNGTTIGLKLSDETIYNGVKI